MIPFVSINSAECVSLCVHTALRCTFCLYSIGQSRLPILALNRVIVKSFYIETVLQSISEIMITEIYHKHLLLLLFLVVLIVVVFWCRCYCCCCFLVLVLLLFLVPVLVLLFSPHPLCFISNYFSFS